MRRLAPLFSCGHSRPRRRGWTSARASVRTSVRTSAVALSLVLGLGCGSPTGLTALIEVGTPFVLAPGGSGVTNDGSVAVRYVKLVSDGRCPPRAYCFWEGDAVIAVVLHVVGLEPRSAELHTTLEPQVVVFAGYRLELLELAPTFGDDGLARIPRGRFLLAACLSCG